MFALEQILEQILVMELPIAHATNHPTVREWREGGTVVIAGVAAARTENFVRFRCVSVLFGLPRPFFHNGGRFLHLKGVATTGADRHLPKLAHLKAASADRAEGGPEGFRGQLALRVDGKGALAIQAAVVEHFAVLVDGELPGTPGAFHLRHLAKEPQGRARAVHERGV
jgi:hypothetical protein